jgi:hypothetical protein
MVKSAGTDMVNAERRMSREEYLRRNEVPRNAVNHMSLVICSEKAGKMSSSSRITLQCHQASEHKKSLELIIRC